MKYIFIFISLFFIINASFSQSNSDSDSVAVYDNELNFSLLQPFWGKYKVGYEHTFNKRISAVALLHLKSIKDQFITYFGYGTELQFRYYINKNQNAVNFYGAFYAGADNTEEENSFYNKSTLSFSDDNKIQYYRCNSGILAGVKFIMDAGVTFDINIGSGYVYSNHEQTSINQTTEVKILDPKYKGLYPKANISIGYLF